MKNRKNSRIVPTMRYQLDYFMWTALIIMAIAIGLMVMAAVVSHVIEGVQIGAIHYAPMMIAAFFIVNLGGIREDARFMLQHGISRRTTYCSNLFACLISSAVLGLFFQLLGLVPRILSADIYFGGGLFGNTSFGMGFVLYTAALFFASQTGALISLIYYRLNRMQQVVFSAAGILGLIWGMPRVFTPFINALTEAEALPQIPQGADLWLFLFLTGFAVLAGLGSFLLIRRAPIKE